MCCCAAQSTDNGLEECLDDAISVLRNHAEPLSTGIVDVIKPECAAPSHVTHQSSASDCQNVNLTTRQPCHRKLRRRRSSADSVLGEE